MRIVAIVAVALLVIVAGVYGYRFTMKDVFRMYRFPKPSADEDTPDAGPRE